MPLSQQIESYRSFAARLLHRGEKSAQVTEDVVVLEQTAGNTWKVVEAKLDEAGITILRARIVEGGLSENASAIFGNLNGSTVTLVPDSGKSLCRLLEIADADPDQLERMVALRLEVELPYPVADTVWVYEPRINGEGTVSEVLVLAMASSPIASIEAELRKGGVRDAVMEFAAGGLVELGNASGPATGTTAVAKVDRSEAILAIAHDASLCYARHLRLSPQSQEDGAPADEWITVLAQELRQSLYDYTMRTGNAAPAQLLVAGERMSEAGFIEALKRCLEMPVEAIECPEILDVSRSDLFEDELLADYSVPVGVLISMRRRMLGEPAAAPPFRRKGRSFGKLDWSNRRFQLLSVNVLLLICFVASLFGVQSLRLNSADRLMRESQPLLQSLERNKEEVDILLFEDRRHRSVLDTMMALSEALPTEIKVESLTIDSRGKISISGKAKTVEMASDTAISALRASPHFENPKFNGATLEKKEFSFQLTCELRGSARRVRR